ncbi:MAG TPA: hypothetical protein VMM79_06625 [Longimicrobiales bacterium]|nr:hypothetical protein [Longimicrobiales bacterium]
MSYREAVGAARPGFSAIEAVVALAVGGMLVAGLAATVIAVSRLERDAADRAEMLAARAHAGTVIVHELRTLDGRRDGFAIGGDSAALRAFRGLAIVCSADSVSADVRYRGLRAPDAAKDSLLVLAGGGPERALPLTGSGSASPSCVARPGESALALRPGSGLQSGDIVLVFERGSYHLTGGALRYRRGASGRQPLTADVFLDDSTDLAIVTGLATTAVQETLAVRLRIATVPRGRPAATHPATRYVPLLNIPIPLDSVPLP